jgi:sugar lactone lactonase YvrE
VVRVDPRTGEEAVVARTGGRPLGLADDVSIAPDGMVYFTDATSGFGVGTYRDDILEHGGKGRLLSFDPRSGQVSLLLSALQFANGVAVSGDGSHLVVAETGSYRLVRYWLDGPRRGTAEPFVENLPGFPDNVTWSQDRKVFWVALWLGSLDQQGVGRIAAPPISRP